MRSKFLLESFDEYVSTLYNSINEAKSPSMTKEQASESIGKIILFQRKKTLQNPQVKSIFTEVFGAETLKKVNASPKSWKWAGEEEGIVDGNPGGKNLNSFFKKIVEFDEKLYSADLKGGAGKNDNYTSAAMMGIFYQFCSPEIRQQLIQEFSDKASELGLTQEKIEKQLEDKDGQPALVGQAPAILGYVDASEVEKKIVVQPKKESYSLLDEKSQKTLFLDNSWDLDPTIGKQLRDQLYGLLERRKAGGKILDLKIQSSASRYRNTGKAEALSWGQLAHKRALVINGMIKEILDELQIPDGDPIRQELNTVSKIDISGSNGDGTSGPNPTGVRIGYYQVVSKQTKDQTGSSKFVDKDGNDPAKVYITKIDGFGNPEREPTVKEIPVLTSKDQYDQYKYVNVYIKAEEPAEKTGGPDILIAKVPANTLVPEVILSKKSKKGESSSTWKFKLPKFKIRILPSGGSVTPMKGFCPEF